MAEAMVGTPASDTVTPRLLYPKIAVPTGAALSPAGTTRADPTWIVVSVPSVVNFLEERGAIVYGTVFCTVPPTFRVRGLESCANNCSDPLIVCSDGLTRTNWVVQPLPSFRSSSRRSCCSQDTGCRDCCSFVPISLSSAGCTQSMTGCSYDQEYSNGIDDHRTPCRRFSRSLICSCISRYPPARRW